MDSDTTPERITLEVCIDSLESAANAIDGGAGRLEVCANLGEGGGGGTTPSVGLVRLLRRRFPATSLMRLNGRPPAQVMVRPRAGDFLYSDDEAETMVEDIRAFKVLGAAGVVLGALDRAGRVDAARTKRFVDEVFPMQVCFHRAFDVTSDAFEAYDVLSQIPGVTRVLTSGHGSSAPASLPVLRELLARSRAPDRPRILPGAGINANTIAPALAALLPAGLREVHLSGGRWIPGGMAHRLEGMGMGIGDGRRDWDVWRTDKEAICAVRRALDEAVGCTS